MRLIILLFCIFCGGASRAQDSLLAHLPGHWINQNDQGKGEFWQVEEDQWRGNGFAHTPDSLSIWERLRIFRRNDTLYYEARVGGAPPVLFHLLLSSEWEMLFVNFRHDFPKVIHYRMPDPQHLSVEVYGDSYARRMQLSFYRQEPAR